MPLEDNSRAFLANEIDTDLARKLNEILETERITFTVAWATLAALLASTICATGASRSEVNDCAEIFGEFVKSFCAETDLASISTEGGGLH